MKKYLKIIIPIILIVILSIYFILKSQHSLLEIAELIDKRNEIPDNVYIKEEVNSKSGIDIIEQYKKDNIIYYKTYKDDIDEYEDIIYNFETKKEIHINYLSKNIFIKDIEGEGRVNPVNYYFYRF